MKKIFFTLMSVFIVGIAANAQSDLGTDANKAAKSAEKEAKAKYKAFQAENIESALKQVGVSDAEIASFKAAIQESSASGTAIRKNGALSNEEKQVQLKANTDAKNAKLREIIGDKRYKEYSKIRKEQKPAEEEIVAPYKN